MTVEEKLNMYKGKKMFVDALNTAFQLPAKNHSVVAVEYEVYKRYIEERDDWYFCEFLVVTFDGGGISVRSANGNSNTANFREIGKLLDGGYYDEVEYYKSLVEDYRFEKVEF